MMWLKANEPDALAKTEHVLFVKDYVRYLLTGEAATDRIEAQGTLMWAMPGTDGTAGTDGTWDAALVALSGLKMSAMPKIIEPTDLAGRVTREAAAFTGLPEGTPVVCGSSDSAVEDYGAGAVEPGDLIIKLATAGNVNSMTAEAHPHPKTLTYSHIVRQLDDRRGAPASEDAHLLSHRAGDVVFGVGDKRRGALHEMAARRVLRAAS